MIFLASPQRVSVPSEFSYGTFANFSPRGSSELSRRSQRIKDAIKAGRASQVQRAIPRLSEPTAAVLEPFLNPAVTLVPVPRSAPLREDALWPSLVIAEVLMAAGFGGRVEPLLERVTAVRKSSSSPASERPLITEHKASLRVRAGLFAPEQITLVDDVLTLGRTTAACAELLQDAFPGSTIRIFAMMRTQGFVPEIEAVFDPSVGIVISHPSGKSHREP